MNFSQLLEMSDKRLNSYKVRQTYSGCQMTVEVLATYHCTKHNRNEQWNFKFYYWRMPTYQYGVYSLSLSKFEKRPVPISVFKVDAHYMLHLN